MYHQARLLLAMMVLLFAPATVPAQTPGVSGSDLMDDCGNYPDSHRPRNCELFANSFAEIARSGDELENPRGRLCIGENVPAEEIIAQINDWLASHPNSENRNGYEIAYDAVKTRYRCR